MCFNPRAPCGARPFIINKRILQVLFQSTRPVRGATRVVIFYGHRQGVSIHAPRAGRDLAVLPKIQSLLFQSTRPVRGATEVDLQGGRFNVFQSTRPVRGATVARIMHLDAKSVSIHAPRAGRACAVLALKSNPRARGGARPLESSYRRRLSGSNPRAPWGARRRRWIPFGGRRGFNPRAPCGARRGMDDAP